jgi:hypothetical protein
MLVGALAMLVGFGLIGCLGRADRFLAPGGLLLATGAITFLIARFGAWWEHG